MNKNESAFHTTLQNEPLIGRQAELDQIRYIVAQVQAGRRQMLLIEGQAGIGKSRLAAEVMRSWRLQGGIDYMGQCSGPNIPYQGWRDVVTALFEINPHTTPTQQLTQLTEVLEKLAVSSEQAGYWLDRLPLLGDVLGLDAPDTNFTRHLSGELRRDNTFSTLSTIIRQQADQHPLMILLEDVHWADELSFSLAVHLAQKLIDVPLLLVLVYRPTLESRSHELMTLRNLPYTQTIQVGPLSLGESRDLLDVLGTEELSLEIKEFLLKRGQGNPFFLEEIVTILSDSVPRQIIAASSSLDLPETVQEMIASRVEQLPEVEQLTLKVASVIGTTFQPELLSHAHPLRRARSTLATHLEELTHKKLIRVYSTDYAFRHRLTQEAIYEGLPAAQCRQLHAIVGAALETLAPDDVELLAFHYSRSDHRHKALHYLSLAARKSQREYANHTAINYYSKILACLEDQAAEQDNNPISADYWDALAERTELYHLIGWRDEEAEDLGTLGLMAEAMADNYRRTLVAKQWARFYETIGDVDSALELIERAVDLAKKTGSEKLLGRAYNRWGKLLYLRGRHDTAYDYLGQAAVIAQSHDDKIAQADSLRNLGIVVYYQADYDVARYFFEQSTDLWQAAGDQANLGTDLRYLGQVYYDTGSYDQARYYFEKALSLHRLIGDRAGQAHTQHQLGKLKRTWGAYRRAFTLFEEALVFYQSVGDYQREAWALSDLGFLHNRLGDYESASTMLEKALTIIREMDAPWPLIKVLTYYGWTMQNNQQLRQARQYITEALKTARDHRLEVAMTEGTALLGQIALSLNDLSLADACARHALKFIETQGVKGIEHPAMVYLTCYRILQANQKSKQAERVLRDSWRYLASQASQIDDLRLRQSYLANIAEHQQLRKLMKESGLD